MDKKKDCLKYYFETASLFCLPVSFTQHLNEIKLSFD
jgi:hypothetical protein